MSNNKIPTAKEFTNQFNRLNDISQELLMIEFAKLHVKAALKEAAENAMCEDGSVIQYGGETFTAGVDKNSILNAYPEDNIK